MSLGLYVHIPFCQAICTYCNFNRGLLDEDLKRRYVDALEQEIRQCGEGKSAGPCAFGPRPVPADTLFFGGGTPSLLEPGEVGRVIEACRESFDLAPNAEITLETNPETASAGRLAAFHAYGVNRVSFGVQSFQDAELKQLGRIHSAARAKFAVRDARAAGFRDVSVDLMLWLPGQRLASWLDTIDQAVELDPDHLSIYLLELYPNAPLKEALERGAVDAQTADDEAADMYLEGLARLEHAGYEQYEISNVARFGHVSRHNVKYWQGGEWVGFGCGAHSTVGGLRWRNVAGTGEYIARIAQHVPPAAEQQPLSSQQRLEEFLFTGLRLSAGISRHVVRERFGVDPWLVYRDRLAPFEDGGWLWRDADRFGLTRRGMLVANEILTVFV